MTQTTKERPLSKRVGRAVGVSATTLAAMSMMAPMAFAQVVGGGGAGGGGGDGGAPASDMALYTLDNADKMDLTGPNAPIQGWGQTSIDYFKNMVENDAALNLMSNSFPGLAQEACTDAIANAVARGKAAGLDTTTARVVQMGIAVRKRAGGGYEMSGAQTANFARWYDVVWPEAAPSLANYTATERQSIYDEFLRQTNSFQTNVRVICIAMNDQEPRIPAPPDYDLTITTDKRTTFTQAGGTTPVNDTIHASATNPTDATVNGTIILNWDGNQGNPKSANKPVTIRTTGDTISPNFTPADFGWTKWQPGRYWFDVRVAKQGDMKNAVDTPDRDPRETWTATPTPPEKQIMLPGTTTPFGSTVELAAGQSYDAHISSTANGYTSLRLIDTITTDKVWIGSPTADVAANVKLYAPNGSLVSGAAPKIDRSQAGKVIVSVDLTGASLNGEYTMVVPTYARPTGTDYTIPDVGSACYGAAFATCMNAESYVVPKVTGAVNKVWVLNQAGALVANDPNWSNNVGADNATFLPGTPVSAVVNGTIPNRLVSDLTSYSITDDWTAAAKYVNFSDNSKHKVFWNGADVTSQFTVTTTGTKTTAVAKAGSAFLASTGGMTNDGTVKLVLNGTFKTDYDTGGVKTELKNAGSQTANLETLNSNIPSVFTITPKPNKVWTLDQAGALVATDPGWTNNVAADEKVFAPGAPVSAVVNGKIPAGLATDMTAYRLVDDWTSASKYVNFSDNSKHKVFFNGTDVTGEFTVTTSGSVTTAVAKPAFLARTGGLAADGSVKLVLNGAFKTDYDTAGQVVKMTNSGTETWNQTNEPTNVPAVYTVTPRPDKVWVLNTAGALVTQDANQTNNVGVDNKVFAPGTPITAVVNGSVPANLASDLSQYSLVDDWSDGSKYVDFPNANAKVYLDGVDVTSQFTITTANGVTKAEAKAAFLANTGGRTTKGVVKLVLNGSFRMDYVSDTPSELVNTGNESWNNKVVESNSPSVYTQTPDPNKAWTLNEAGALVTVDANWTNKVGVDGYLFLPGTPITAVVNGSVPKNLGAALSSYTITDNWTDAAPYANFADQSKHKVYLDGVDVTSQFDITTNNSMTVAKAKPAFLAATANRTTDGVVKLVLNGSFRTDYDTNGQVAQFVNAGSEAWNGKIMPTNTPPLFTQTPKPNKVWTLDQAGALVAADANWTNNVGADERLFAPGTPVSAVVNGKIPANMALDMTAYRLTDNWSDAAEYVDFTDNSKHRVFLDGFDVTSDFTVTTANGITTAVAKPSFLANTGQRADEGEVKLILNGVFRSDYSTDGQVVKMLNKGTELWNGTNKETNVPAVYTATPKPDKVWVLDNAGALVTADPNWTNNVGSDNKVFLPADGVAAVVNGKIPGNLATNLTKYVITDDWTAAAKYVDFSDASKARVYYQGNDVTSQFDVKVEGTKTIATAKPEFLAKTAGLSKDAQVKLVISGKFRSDYDTDGKLVTLTNSGFETWNTRTEPSNVPAVFTWTPDPHKQVLASAYQGGDQSDINGLQVFPGQKIEYSVQIDLRIPDNLAWGENAVKTLSVEDTYDPLFTPDKPSVEFWDARTQRVIPRSVYKLTWNDAAHSFQADFDANWVKENVTPSDKGWLILRFDGQVKADAPDGSIVDNQAFQILNGVKIGTEIPKVIVPSWMPKKEDLNTDLQNIDGKTVVQGDILLYRLTLDGGPARNKLAYDVHKLGIVDDYDEGYLDLDAKAIQVLDKATGADVTSKFNVQVKDGKAYVFAKQVDHTNINGDLIKGDPQPADLAAYDAKAIDPINDAIIDQSMLGKQYWVILPSKVNKEVDGYVIKNQARQNLENTWKDTEIVSNPLKDIDPVKDVVISEQEQDSIDTTEVKLDSLFNYKLSTSTIPANRAYGARQWSITDTFDGAHDRYTGQWAIYAGTDVYDGSTRIFKKGDLLADFAHHESETYKDFFKVTWDAETNTIKAEATKKFFDFINTRGDQEFSWDLYVQMERVAPGDKITNTHTERYNDVDRESNEVWTKTFEHPSIAVKKFTLDEGIERGDRNFADQPFTISLAEQIKAAKLGESASVKVGFRVTNTGDVNLKDVALSDVTEEGTTGKVENLLCTIVTPEETAAALNAGSATKVGETTTVAGDKIGLLPKGQSVDCVGTLTGMKPGELHTDTATAKGKSVFTGKEVSATDPWNAATAPEKPSVKVVKFTSSEGAEKGDRNNPADPFEISIEEQVAAALKGEPTRTKVDFTVVNDGDVPLTDVKLTDVVDEETKGAMENLTCEVPDADAAGKTTKVDGDKIANLDVGQSVDCTADMVGLKPSEVHTDTATVVGKSLLSGKEVTDNDPWNAAAEKETPFIDVEKFTFDEGPEAGDRDDETKPFEVTIEKQVEHYGDKSKGLAKIGFTVTNKGDVPLTDVKLTDLTDPETKGKIVNLLGTIEVPKVDADGKPVLGEDGKQVIETKEITGYQIGQLAVGQTVHFVGDLVDMLPSEVHKNTATAVGKSLLTGTEVTDEDPWNANTAPEKPEIDVEKYTLSEGVEKGDRDTKEAAYKLGAKSQATPETNTPQPPATDEPTTPAPAEGMVKTVNGVKISITDVNHDTFTITGEVDPAAEKKPVGVWDMHVFTFPTPLGNGASEYDVTSTKNSIVVKWDEVNGKPLNPDKKITQVELSLLPQWVGAPGDATWKPVLVRPAAATANPTTPTTEAPTTETPASTEATAAKWTAEDTVEVGYTITNKGNVPLKDVVLTDEVKLGSGKVTDLSCTITDADGKETKVAGDKIGELAVGAKVDCTAKVSGILPEEWHQNTAKVVGKSVFTDAEVTDADDWWAKAPGHPKIDVEKYTLSEGLTKGDRDKKEEALVLTDEQVKNGVQIGFKVTNTGDTWLKDVKLSDKTIVGSGKVNSLACTVIDRSKLPTTTGGADEPKAQTPAPTATATPTTDATEAPAETQTPPAEVPTMVVTGDKIGELAPGQSVECVATLTGIQVDVEKDAGKVVLHQNTATVTAESKIDSVKVTDADDWNASVKVPEKPTPEEPEKPGEPKEPKPEPKGTQTGDQLLGNNPGIIAGGLAALLAALGLGAGAGIRNRRRNAAAGVTVIPSDDQE